MLKCLVVDDELLAIDVLASYIPQVPFLQLVASYNNPVEALVHLQKEDIDLIFLDIQMPKLTGIQFMNLLNNRSQVILVTAFNDFAMLGYEHNVTDYLLKPVSFERFLRAAEKAAKLAETMQGKKAESANPDNIFVKANNKIIKISLNDILYIEGLRNYISIYTDNNKRIVTLQNMKTLEEVLPAGRFIRVQKSYIVNLDKIDAIEKQSIYIGTQVIPIGESFSQHFFAVIGKMGG